MGPNALKIIEELFDSLNTVFATNLWISATENYKRIKSMGPEDKIMPIHAEAHYLPSAHKFFDLAIRSYFGVETESNTIGFYVMNARLNGKYEKRHQAEIIDSQ